MTAFEQGRRASAAAACSRLPRLPSFARSGGWQIRRPPRGSTLGPNREGEQSASSGPSLAHATPFRTTGDEVEPTSLVDQNKSSRSLRVADLRRLRCSKTRRVARASACQRDEQAHRPVADPERLPEAAMEVRPIADMQAFLSMHARAIRSGRASSGRFLWHQLDLQLATDRARVPLERRQRRRMLARRFQA